MTAVIISSQAKPPIEIAQYIRNGKAPSAELQSKLAEACGFTTAVRTKFIFGRATPIPSLPSSTSGTRPRWEFGWDSSAYASTLIVFMELAPQNNGSATAPYGLIEVKPINDDGTEGSVVGVARVAWGAGTGTGTTNDVPLYFGGGLVTLVDPTDLVTPVTLSTQTPYCATISDVDYARVHSVAVWEATLSPDTDNGYPKTGVAVNTPIYDKDRADVAVMLRNLWHTAGNLHWNWCSETVASAPSQSSGDNTGSLAQSIGSFTLSAAGTVATTPPSFISVSSFQSSIDGDFSVTWPAHLANDIVILAVATRHGVTPSVTAPGNPFSTEATFTHILSVGSGSEGSPTSNLHLFYSRASATNMAPAAIITSTADNESSELGIIEGAAMVLVRGCVTSGSPVDAASSTNVTSPATAVTLTNFATTTSVSNTFVIGFIVTDVTSQSIGSWAHSGSVTNVTERLDSFAEGTSEDYGTSFIHLAIVTGDLASAGNANNFTATLATSSDQALGLIALKP
jgi:hypothetical protein